MRYYISVLLWNLIYTYEVFLFTGLACVTIQCVRYYIIVLLWNLIYTYEVFFIHRYIPMRYFLFIGIYLWITSCIKKCKVLKKRLKSQIWFQFVIRMYRKWWHNLCRTFRISCHRYQCSMNIVRHDLCSWLNDLDGCF